MGLQEYLNDLLNNQLKEIKYRFRERVVADIRDRMCSLLAGWEDEAFRTTILFVTEEEALFYEPDAPNVVKEFVVATIRNSMLEIAASDNCSQFKMQEALPDEKIRSITSNAILYFRQCEFKDLQAEAEGMEYTDVYGEAVQKYPLAWKILKRAASMTNEGVVFERTHKSYSPDTDFDFAGGDFKTAVCDGYSLEFDDSLREGLEGLASGLTDVFYVDSFKMLTRNFEKVLHVLQIIFEQDKIFATCNYYISDGEIEKREKILRAAHSERDVFDHIRNRKGVPARLRSVLEGME